jgi:hypothetical protein
MRTLVCLLTSLVFAVHALVGCGAHRSCEHRTAILSGHQVAHESHDCVAHHHGDREAPEDGEHDSSAPCSHSVCSYVKAETQQVDLSNAFVAFWTAMGPIEVGPSGAMSAAIVQPVCRGDLSSTQLYVWHCALII